MSNPGVLRSTMRWVLPALLLAALLTGMVLPAAGATPGIAQVQPEKSYYIESFDPEITVLNDGTLRVRELQYVNFTGSYTFYTRFLDTTKASFSEGRTYGNVRYKNIKVFNPDGSEYKRFKVKNVEGGVEVKLTFPATGAGATHGWIIEYDLKGAMVYAEKYDRLYYNALPVQRSVPILASTITVNLPEGLDAADTSDVKATGYENVNYPPSSIMNSTEGNRCVWMLQNIPPNTTYTIDIGMRKGAVVIPLVYRGWYVVLMIAIASLLFLGTFIFMLIHWLRHGRDIAVPELDVVRYEPPEDLTPAELAYVMNEKPGNDELTATIIDLAVRGKIVIEESVGKGIRKKRSFTLVRKDPGTDDLAGFELELMNALFTGRDRVTVKELKNEFYTAIPKIHAKEAELVVSKGFFDEDPGTVRGRYSLIGVITIIVAVGLFFLFTWRELGMTMLWPIGLGAAGLVIMIAGSVMPRKSAKGSEMVSYAKGYKEYMATAEADEISWMTPENFQRNLPYAMVLGVEKQWAKRFEGIFSEPPDWYSTTGTGTFSTLLLVNSLGDMRSDYKSAFTSRPSSDGGGGFGGGSSGGGFGGGGVSAG